MMKKINLKFTILTILNLALCLCLIIFKSPIKVPFLFNFKEEIVNLMPKWILLACAIIPTILFVLICTLKKKDNLNFFFKMLFVTALYENMLIMIYISGTDTFKLHTVSEIPISLFYVLPIPFYMLIGALKLKFAPYKSFSPFKNKYSLESEFVWKQAHIHASKVMFSVGFILTILAMVFAILRLLIVNLILLATAIIIVYILVMKNTIQISKKHAEMQAKKDKLNEKSKEEQPENNE